MRPHVHAQVELLARLKPVEVEVVQHWLRLPAALDASSATRAPGFFDSGTQGTAVAGVHSSCSEARWAGRKRAQCFEEGGIGGGRSLCSIKKCCLYCQGWQVRRRGWGAAGAGGGEGLHLLLKCL